MGKKLGFEKWVNTSQVQILPEQVCLGKQRPAPTSNDVLEKQYPVPTSNDVLENQCIAPATTEVEPKHVMVKKSYSMALHEMTNEQFEEWKQTKQTSSKDYEERCTSMNEDTLFFFSFFV